MRATGWRSGYALGSVMAESKLPAKSDRKFYGRPPGDTTRGCPFQGPDRSWVKRPVILTWE